MSEPERRARFNNAWAEQARCRAVPVELFYPEDPSTDPANVRAEVCAACPVRSACLEHAMSWPEDFGIFGGMTPPERLRLADRRGR